MDDINRNALMLPQTQSPLFALPEELRNWIYDLVLTPSSSITNPSFDTTVKPKYQDGPRVGVAILRTCRAIYLEANSSALLRNGDFIFTRMTHIQAFFSQLSLAQASLIKNITIDLRETAPGCATLRTEQSAIIANEWLHYLNCLQGAHMPGTWCSNLSTLKADIPHLRSLCIDLTNWQPSFAGARIGGWEILQSLLRKPRGLDSITLRCKCLDSSSWSSQSVPWSLGLWFSPAFDKDESALVDLIAKVTREEREQETKVLEWQVIDGVTLLTVRIEDADKIPSLTSDARLPENGRMWWSEYLEFKEGQEETVKRRKGSLPVSEVVPHGAHVIVV